VVRFDEAVEHFEQCGLSRTVVAYQAQALSSSQFERHIVYRPELAGSQFRILRLRTPERIQVARDILNTVPERAFQAAAEFLAHPLHLYQNILAIG
jgi:hypothetical protein